MKKFGFHALFVVALLFELHQSAWGVITALRGEGIDTLIFRGMSFALLGWAYASYLRGRRRGYGLALLGFCVVDLTVTVMNAVQYANLFPEGSFLKFHFFVIQAAKCQIGDVWGCGYLIVNAYLLPIMFILLGIFWYEQFEAQRSASTGQA